MGGIPLQQQSHKPMNTAPFCTGRPRRAARGCPWLAVPAAVIGLLAGGFNGPAAASIQCRLTSPIAETGDIAAQVQSDLGAGCGVADWLALKDQYAGEPAAFLNQTGLANGGIAWVTFNGSRFFPDDPTRHYYVIRSDAGPPTGDTYDSFGTLYLQSWHGFAKPVVATTGYRLGANRTDLDDTPALLVQEFGIGTLMAEWNTLKSQFPSSFTGLHRQTGQTNFQSVFVTWGGERWNSSWHHHYANRYDSGTPGGYSWDQQDTLFLQAWFGITMQPMATVTLRQSAAMAETADIPALLAAAYGSGAVMVDWDEIKAQGAAKLGGFYAATGLRDGQIAWVTRGGARFNPDFPESHYYVIRSDSGNPYGVEHDVPVGSLYLQSWFGFTKPALCKLAVPPVPTGLAASDNTHADRVALTWTNGARTDSCKIWYNTINSPYSAVLRAEAVTGNSFDDFSVVPGQTHYYWVEARNSAGVSAWSVADAGTRLYQIALDPAAKSLSNSAQSYTVAVTSNGAWTVADDRDWITLAPPAGSGNGTVTVTVTANNSSVASRFGTVTIGGQSHAVSQEGIVWPSPATFRLTPPSPETDDLAALAAATFGPDATVADWNQITAQCRNNLAGFYAATGLGDHQLAWTTFNGNHFDPADPQRHYYVMRSDVAPPDGRTYAFTGSLYLQSWSGMTKPTVARMRYQLSAPVFDTTDPLDWVRRDFGSGVQVAEWNNIKAIYAANPNLFYAHTGLRDRSPAWVKCGGLLAHPTLGWRYFLQRADNGAPNIPTPLDQAGTLYLGVLSGPAFPVLADMAAWSATGFESYIAGFPGVPAELSGRTDDPDHDGSVNFAEFAAATHPGDGSVAAGLYDPLKISSLTCTVCYRENTNAPGVELRVQWSPDLVQWAGSGDFIGTVKVQYKQSVIETGTGYRVVRVSATVGSGGPIGRLFLRTIATETTPK